MASKTNTSVSHSPETQPPGSPPMVDTVVRATATQSGRGATHSMKPPKTGRGALIAIMVVPALIFIVVIAGYWMLAVARTNFQQEAPLKQRNADTTAPR